ncbi:MAG TPA: acyltransferase [Actinopolymorphaceae bacterium]
MAHNPDHPPHRTGFPSLTGIRGLAAAIVFLNHIGYLIGATAIAGVWHALRPVSITGVICFFTLSGFLLSQPGSLRGGVRSFWRRRAARILPVYWFILILSAAYLLIRSTDDARLRPLNVLLNVVLLQSWSPRGQDASINLPSWSLSVELLFYIAIPLLLPSLARWFSRWPRASLVAVGILGAIGSLSLEFGWVNNTLPLAYFPIFLLGVHAAVTAKAHLPLQWAVAAAAIGVISYPILHNYLIPAFGFMFLIASLADRDRLGHPSWLAGRSWKRFGEWSYAFFLVHVLVIDAAGVALSSSPRSTVVGLGACVVAFVASWVLAAVIYRVVEEPMRLRLSRSPKPPTPTPTVSATTSESLTETG